jgi:hypothetical protein
MKLRRNSLVSARVLFIFQLAAMKYFIADNVMHTTNPCQVRREFAFS